MHKHSVIQRALAAALGAAVALAALPLGAFAEGLSALSEGVTLPGEPQTVQVAAAELGRANNFNAGWKFYLGKNDSAQNQNFDDSGWEDVALPHDFSITQPFTTSGEAESGFLPGGTGWYRKTFTLPESCAGKTLLLNFDGVYSDAYVYVNGSLLGENHYGYTAFAFDISDAVVCDGVTENVIAVKAVNDIPSSRWYSGSGIYRDVTLLVADPVHVNLNGVYVTTPDIAAGSGAVQAAVEVVNDSAEAVTVTVRTTVYEKNGETQLATDETAVTAAAGATVTATASPVVSSPKLWSVDAPNLYTVRTELVVDGTVRDTCDTTFGFRYFSFDDKGFHLNGKSVKLNGVCLHHDQGALGSAAYYDAMYRQLSIMKDMGVNAIRTSHNPADEDFIAICDELGLLVVEEAFDGWSKSKNGNSNDFGKYFAQSIGSGNYILGGSSSMTWAEFAIKSMVKRDRNAPSVILWSLGNEIQEGASAPSTYPTIAQNLIDWIKEVDTTRQATIGSNQRTTSGVLGSVHSVVVNNGGIVGFNYASQSELATLHSTYGPLIASETSSAVNSRGIYSSQGSASNADGKYHLTSYDTSKVSWGKTAHDSMWDTLTLDYVAGEFVWTGFDYIGEPTPWNGTGSGSVSKAGAIPNSSYFGIVDTAGFEKDTYYLYRSQWNQKETTLHLVTAWDSDNMLTTSGKTPVVVYSNAPVVKLYRNGALIGTATRKTNTTAAGHTYYTYTTVSNDSSVCTAVNGSNSTSLYATFNVTYEAGTISAKAFEADGETEIPLAESSGRNTVSTPDAPAQLKVTLDQNKTEINADGSSLVYIEVEVQDAAGNLDTTAANTISFTLAGNGEIVGVDNGDQATTDKYQQASVLAGSTSANIAAYAGKALVIVRSTKDAGSFTVNASSSGLTGGSATVATHAVGGAGSGTGLVSYTMVRDYTVLTGTVPALGGAVTGTLADGTEVSGTVAWGEIPADMYNTAGDYTIPGTITFDDGTVLAASCRLHVVARVAAVRNISTVTMPNTAPTLPNTVKGVMADGTLTGEFAVTWEMPAAEAFAEVGQIVTVNGTASIFGEETKPVTAAVRVAEAVNTESVNVAPSASSLVQDIPENKQSDNLESILNGITKPGDNTNERWSNWNNRTNSATATLTFRWDTAQMLSSVNLYYYYDSCSAKPESVDFAYSLNGTDFTPITAAEELIETYSLGAEYTYTFAQPVNPVALKITFTQQGGTSGNHCVALTEAEIMTFAGALEYNASADLSGIAVNGAPVEGFAADTLAYTVAAPAETAAVTAETTVNAGITVLPVYENVVRILTVSEDGSAEHTYAVTLNGETVCSHEHTEVRNVKAATCTEEGYTGDTYCLDCGELVAPGTAIPAAGHSPELRNAKEASCTETGYTGDKVCAVCGETIETGSVIPAKGHSWDDGKVTKEPTETEEGVKTYTCTVCGETKTEAIPANGPAPAERTAPEVTLSASANAGKLVLTGCFADYENLEKYYDVTAHGLVYISSAKLGTHNLTVNTAGRTRVNFSGYKADGSFTYQFKPAYGSTRYTVRAFLSYVDPATGRTVYVYSAPMVVSYDGLAGMAAK